MKKMKCKSFEESCKEQDKLMYISAAALSMSVLSFQFGTWLAFVGVIMGMSALKNKKINKYNKITSILAVGIGLMVIFMLCMFFILHFDSEEYPACLQRG